VAGVDDSLGLRHFDTVESVLDRQAFGDAVFVASRL